MAIVTPEDAQQQRDEFAQAFASGDAAVQEQPPEDEVDESMVDLAEEEQAESPVQAEEVPAVAEAAAQGNAPVAEAGDEPMDPKDQQRMKSWEGRLKAYEAELKAREDAIKAVKPSESAEGAAPQEEAPVVEAIEEVAEKVESGAMTIDQAMQVLSNDFGPEYVKAIDVLIEGRAQAIAAKLADEKVGAVRGEMDGLAKEIVDDKRRMHVEMISDAHPDFVEVAGSEAFKAYIDGLPEQEKAKAMSVIEAGSAMQINRLLSTYKGATKGASKGEQEDAAPMDQSMDDAEGVRSSGLRIPKQPSRSDDYSAAWEEF